jgi:NitT/TauT family transport system substrate-binding protein
MLPLLVSNQLDVGINSVNAGLFNAFARGLPVKIVADHGANVQGASAGGIAIRKDLVDSGAYQGPASLKGWKIATASQGSNSDITLDAYLRGGGLTLADIDRVNLSYPDMLPALANKAIDGAYYQEPFTTMAVERGLAARGPAAWQIRLGQQVGVVLLSERLLRDRALSLRYVRAYTRGVRDYVKGLIDRDPTTFDQVVPILIEHTTVKDRALFEKAVPSGLRGDPIPNVDSIAEAQEWFLANGFQNQRVSVQDMLDLSFVQQAIEQLGPYR